MRQDKAIYHCNQGRALQEEFEDTKRSDHNPYIEERQTTQWPKKRDKWTNTDLQNTKKTKKNKTKLKMYSGALEELAVPAPLVAPIVLP